MMFASDVKKFFTLSLLMCGLLFISHLLWGIKNTLVIYAAGVEALSLLKLIGTLPIAFAFMLLYSKLATRYSRTTLFYLCIVPFLLFFALFSFVIYPNKELLHPTEEWVENLSTLYPRAKTALHLLGSWSYALFYVACDLWASVSISLLFWQLANDSVSKDEAKRFYPLLGFVGNLSIMAAGIVIYLFSEGRSTLPDPWGYTLNVLMLAILLCGIGVLFLYRKVAPHNPMSTQEKPTLSLKESSLHLRRSKELLLLALMVIGFGISQKIMEGLWHDQVSKCHPDQNSYSAFVGKLSLFSGLATLCFMAICRGLSYRYLAHFVLLCSALFFFLVLGAFPPLIAVLAGSLQDVLSKTTKYTFTDPIKEMTYMGLDVEAKVKGKAAVDVVGERIGKHGGALIQQFFLLITASTLTDIAPYLALVCLAGLGLWLFAAAKLDPVSKVPLTT